MSDLHEWVDDGAGDSDGSHRRSSFGARVEMMSSVLDRYNLRYLCNMLMEMPSMQLYTQL